jgi:hypothetical protein
MHPGELGTAVSLADGAHMVDITITLLRGAVISGILRAPDGRPAANVGVEAAVAQPRGPRFTATTDDRGVYRFFGLPGGDYLVSSWLVSTFSPGEQSTSVTVRDVDAALAALERRFSTGRAIGSKIGGAMTARAAPTSADATTMPRLRPLQVAPTFYPGTIDRSQAMPIAVAPAEIRDNVDFQFVLAGTVDVSGIVRLSDGRPAAGAIVSVGIGRTTASAADGTFRIAGVSPGHQTIGARLTAFSAAMAAGRPIDTATLQASAATGTALWAADEVDVPANGLTNVDVMLRPGMTLAGRVVFDLSPGARPASFATVRLRIEAAGVTTPPVVRPDGSFDVRGIVPGPVRIAGSVSNAPAPGWWLRSAMLDGRDVLDRPLEFDAATGNVAGLVVTFSDRHTEIAGRFETPAGAAATAYIIAVVPTDRRFWYPGSRRMAFTRPATDGRFAFHDLPPGAYAIVALTDLDPATWETSSFLEPLAAAGVPVTLAEGGRVIQDLRIAGRVR